MNNSLEQQVLILHQAGYSIRTIANHLGINKSRVQRILEKIQKVTSDTTIETAHETGDTGYVSMTDTPANTGLDMLFDTATIAMRQPSNMLQSINIPHSKYGLNGIGQLMRQVGILKEDINDFVTDTAWLNQGGVSILFSSYQLHLRRAKRLIQSINLLTEQLGVDYNHLLVTQVLQNIQTAIEEDFSNAPVPKQQEDTDVYILHRDTGHWMEVLGADFLQPVNQ